MFAPMQFAWLAEFHHVYILFDGLGVNVKFTDASHDTQLASMYILSVSRGYIS